jgi:DNA-binding transcriptional LysR family regulator
MDLTALRSFVTVADTGKVTAAATRLNLTQSAVSIDSFRI